MIPCCDDFYEKCLPIGLFYSPLGPTWRFPYVINFYFNFIFFPLAPKVAAE